MTRFRVIRHRLVERDVARIAGYLLEHTTPQSVARTIAALETDAGALGRNPYRGTGRDEIAHGLRAVPSAGKGVIAFEVREETRTVRILSITWGGFDWLGRVVERARWSASDAGMMNSESASRGHPPDGHARTVATR